MRNLKKFLALVLSMMMVLSLVVTASANSISGGKDQVFNDNNAIEAKFLKAVEVLNGMDVLKGDADASGAATGNFRPSATITRAEVAAMVFRLATGMTGAHDADHFAQYGNFSDVKDDAWYAGYVGYCANAGYIKGYEGEYGPFGPADPVTGYQALAMILRAIGYGVNGEFEGRSWQVNVASIGQETHILDNINSTAFGGATLQQAARRDVVAEIYFQAAQKDRVVYTPAFGYQTTRVQAGTLNNNPDEGKDSLGYINFGLWKTNRIVVGNQATGESCTILGPSEADKIEYKTDTFAEYTMYDYPGHVLADKNDGITKNANSKDIEGNDIVVVPDGLNIDLKSGIDLFGHKVEVWYNDKPAAVHQTYAYYDDVVRTSIVRCTADDVNIGVFNDDPDQDDILPLGSAAMGAGFNVSASSTIYTSDRFGMINTTPGQQSAATPIQPDHDKTVGDAAADATNDCDLYLLISNNAGKTVDVVVSLEAELAEIRKHDTTASTKTLTLGDTALLSGTESLFGQKRAADTDGVIRMNSLTETSEKGLGELVTAWEIKGTNYDYDSRDDSTVSENLNQYFYQLNKIEKTITAVVETYVPATGHVNFVSPVGGKSSLDFTILPIISNAVSMPATLYNGREYTFYLDEMGRYVKAVQNSGYEFLYGTFADYEIGGLGTGTIKYAITGVNWNGEKVINADLKSINQVPVAGANYELLTLAKKNLGNANAGQVIGIGNELQKGIYTGYAHNKTTGDLNDNLWNTHDATRNIFWDGHIEDSADGCSGLSTTDTWVINKTDAANGFADLNNPTHTVGSIDGTLLATPNTKFILVEGTGSDTLNVDIRTGISGLLGTADSVEIDANIYNPDGTDSSRNYNIYFKTANEKYNNVDTTLVDTVDNDMVDVVILPKEAVTWSNTSTLYFSLSTGSTGTLLADTASTDGIYQYVLYQGGSRGTYFVDTNLSDGQTDGVTGAADGATTDNINAGTFYQLTEVRKINGTPIYKAEKVYGDGTNGDYRLNSPYTTPLGICNTLLTYEYIATNNTATARIGGEIFNVSNANVTNLSGTGTITNVRELNNAISVGYEVTVAIVNNGLNVSQIYVVSCSK